MSTNSMNYCSFQVLPTDAVLSGEMHKCDFRPGIRLDPAGGAYSAHPNPLLDYGELYLYGEMRRGEKGKEREMERNKSSNINLTNDSRYYFNFELPSELLMKRKEIY